MIGYVDGSLRMHCDWCYARSPEGPSRDLAVRPARWGVAMVVHSPERTETRHACPRHTRQLRAWERNGLEAVR